MDLNSEEKALILQHRKAKRKKHEPSRSLQSYSSEERSNKFARLYEMAKANFDHLVEHGCEEKDIEHWLYEQVMQLLGSDIFDAVNALTE